MSNWNPNAPGGQGGGQQPPQQGGFGQQPPPQQQGGFGQQPPPQGGLGQPQHQGGFAQHPPPQHQGYGQPPAQQGGFGQPQHGYGYPGQQTGFGPTGPGGPGGQRPKKSNGMIIGIVAAGVAVLALVGVAIGLFFGGDKDDPVIPPPIPPTAAPTTPGATPSPTPTTSPTTSTSQAPADAIEIGQGLNITPAAGWSVVEQDDDAVLLRDARGRVFLAQSGRSADPRSDVQAVLNTITEAGTDVRKNEVQTPQVHESLNIASQAAQMTAASGSGSAQVGVLAVVSSRTADQVAFVAIVMAPAGDFQDEAFTDEAGSMLGSLWVSQIP